MEKPLVDPHREYLDMDTDEEEFGKPETPEPEEETPPEPEKPIFSFEELEMLVQYAKDFTVLPALDESDWNEDCHKIIRDFFQDPAKIVLSIFYDGDVLTALLDFPNDAVDGLTYFLRYPWQIFTPQNFHTTVNFGSLSGNVENLVLKVMENVYSLIIFSSKDWPSVKRNDILTNTHNLLTRMTDLTYKLMGFTALYVPRDGIDLHFESKTLQARNQFVLVSDDEAKGSLQDAELEIDETKDKGELLGRLEIVANFWIRQIREAIANQKPAGDIDRVTDELTFWKYRYDNLKGLRYQIQNVNVFRIVEKLQNVQFTSIRQFQDLTICLETAIDEASANIDYLNLLTYACSTLQIPEIQEQQVSEFLYLISFIWLESPFNNSKARIERLCQALSAQIVDMCRESINLNTIFQGDTIEGKQKLQVSIDCCWRYKKIYDEYVEVISKINEARCWGVDRENIFNHVNAFIRRCQDVMEICDLIVVFGRSPSSMCFGGSNGPRYEKDCNKIENLLYKNLRDIENVQQKILDVTETSWIDHITLFRCGITELEVMVGNLINSIFEDENSIEESIEALYTLQRYNQHKCINELLNLKWVEIWKMFDEEIGHTKERIINQTEEYDSSTPYYSGRASILRLQQNRLMHYQTIYTYASDWLGDCEAQIPVLKTYKKLISATVKEEKLLFDAWELMMGEEKSLTSPLSEPVLRRGKFSFGVVTVNMNYNLLNTLEEAKVWISLNYDVKPLWKKFSTKWLILKLRYEGIALLCRSYNAILKRLFNHSLFKELLKNLENSIALGFEKVTWNSPEVEKFYADCSTEVSNLQEFVDLYEMANVRIDQLFEDVSNIRFIQDHQSLTNCEVKDFSSHLEKQKADGMRIIIKYYEDILRLLKGIQEGFKVDFEEIIQYWYDFIKAKDDSLKEALCSAVRRSLQSVSKLIKDNGSRIQKTLFQIKVDYIDNQLIISEEINEIEEVLRNIFKFILPAIKPLELFSTTLEVQSKDGIEFWEFINEDEICLNLQNDINSEVEILKKAITDYISSIEWFEEISMIDIPKINQDYAINESDREVLETDITRCTKLGNAIENLANEVPVSFVNFNMSLAKVKMIDKCESWREILFIELSKVIVTEQKSDATTPSPIDKLSLCSFEASDDSN